MANNGANFAVRFSVRDQETVREALRQLGKDGEAVLAKLDKASNDAGRGQDSLAGNIANTAKAADNALTSVSGFVKGLIGGAAITAAIALYKQVKDQLVELGDRAQDTRLLPQQLQALNLAAADARVPAEKLNAALDKFTEVSKQSEDGAQAFYKALGNIGQGFVQAFKDAPSQSERLRILMDALKAAPNEVSRAQLALQAFGSENERLISIFDKGRSSMQGFIDQAARLGLTVDDAMIKKADAASRNMGVLGEVIRQKLLSAIGELMPVARDLMPTLERLAAAARDFFASFASLEARPSSTLRNQFQSNLADIEKLEGEIEKIKSNKDNVWEKLFGDPQKAIAERQQGIDRMREQNKQIQDIVSDETRRRQAATAPIKEPPAFKPRPNLTPDPEEKDAFEREADRISKHIALTNADAEAVGKSAGEHERLRVEAALVEAMLRAGIEISPEYATKIASISDAAEKAAAGLEKAKNQASLQNLAMEAANLEKGLADGLASSLRGSTQDLLAMAKGTETLGQGLENLSMKILEAVANALLMKAVVGPLANALSGGLGAMFGGVTPSALGNVFDGGNLVPFARGGIFSRPTIFPMANGGIGLAGEAGPEAIMPLARDSAGRLGVRGGGGPMAIEVNVINAPAGTQADATASQRPDGKLQIDVALRKSQEAAFRKDMADGGPMSRSIAQTFGVKRILAA